MSVPDLLKQIKELNEQIAQIQVQCPHNLQEKYRNGLAGYYVRCLECKKTLKAFWGARPAEERATYKEVGDSYFGCEDFEAHKMYHAVGTFCPCK